MSVWTGNAHRLGRDAVAGQERALALGGRAAVAPHRGDDERPEAHLLEGVDRRPGDRRRSRDPPAADPDRDRPAGRNPLAEPALEDQPADRPRHVLHPGLGDRLPNAGQRREVHRGLTLARQTREGASGGKVPPYRWISTLSRGGSPGQFEPAGHHPLDDQQCASRGPPAPRSGIQSA